MMCHHFEISLLYINDLQKTHNETNMRFYIFENEIKFIFGGFVSLQINDS